MMNEIVDADSDLRVRFMGQLGETRQRLLFELEEPSSPAADKREELDVGLFRRDSPEEIFIGEIRLRRFLEDSGFGWVLKLRSFLEGFDFSELEKRYARRGRRAIHPRVHLGLIIYGMSEGKWSLRELEVLAKRDLCAWWLCGGIQPDHSTIGKFIYEHRELLTERYFVELTKAATKQVGGMSSNVVAMDGTVLPSVGSRYKTLTKEAAREALKRAEATGEEEKIQAAREVLERVEARDAKRQEKGRKVEARISATDPDAVYQKQKDKTSAPSYKPSLCVNGDGLITGQHVEASSETAAVKPMLAQHKAIVGEQVKTLLLDAGYHCLMILQFAVALGIDILCPSGRADRDDEWQKADAKGKFAKQRFEYDEVTDRYKCPAGKYLEFESTMKMGEQQVRRYRGRECGGCPLRSRCTQDKRGRTIRRYPGDNYKEAMAEVLEQPQARQQYRQRQAIVEPKFSQLRYRQGLNRFRRRGLEGVSVELSLHCIAHNLKWMAKRSEGEALAVILLRFSVKSGENRIVVVFYLPVLVFVRT